MSIYTGVFDRMKKSWDFLLPINFTHKSTTKAPMVIKLNLPPLMGRRDAAYDSAYALVTSDIFGLPENQRIEIYSNILMLLKVTFDDTSVILRTLTSPDTERRERAYQSFIGSLLAIVQLLEGTVSLQNFIINDENGISKEFFSRAASASETAKHGKMLNDAELNLTNYLRANFKRASDKISGYREYTGKSFSKSNSERYMKSYNSYLQIHTAKIKEK